MIGTGGTPSCFARSLNGWKQYGYKDGDYCDNNQQFNQRQSWPAAPNAQH
jgi:hypothetical protein